MFRIEKCSRQLAIAVVASVLLTFPNLASSEHSENLVNESMGAVHTVTKSGEDLWIGSDEGLFIWDRFPRGEPRRELHARVWVLLQWKGTLWIGADEGLFRWDHFPDGKPQRERTNIGAVHALLSTGTDLWIGSDDGLFRWERSSSAGPQKIAMDYPIAGVLSLCETNGTLWVGTRVDLKMLNRLTGKLIELPKVETTWALMQSGRALLIASSKGLYEEDLAGKEESDYPATVPLPITDTPDVFSVLPMGAKVLIGSGAGLYEMEVDHTSVGSQPKPRLLLPDVAVWSVFQQKSDEVWVGTDEGLFRILGATGEKWNPEIAFTSNLPHSLSKDQPVIISWKITNLGYRTSTDLVNQVVVLRDDRDRLVELPSNGAVQRGTFQYTLPPLSPGNYRLAIQVKDLFGTAASSKELALTVGESFLQLVTDVARYVGVIYAVASFLTLVVLLIGSRYSERFFRILTDPTMRKIGIYFGFLVLYIPAVRIWIFERYFRTIKGSFLKVAFNYLPGTVYRPDGSVILSSQISDELSANSHLWVQGGAGSGKSAMIQYLARSYFLSSSLQSAWKEFGFIPIIVPLRELTGGSVSDLARKSLTAGGMPFDDAAFFDRLLRTGSFLVVLDGLNETDLDKEVTDFAASTPSVQLIVTSQLPPNGEIPKYVLPVVTGTFAKELLRVFLGVTVQKVPSERLVGLWEGIQSAYDVRLLATLIEADQDPPNNRIGLYEAILKFAFAGSAEQLHFDVISSLAWNMWKTSKRRFRLDEQVTGEIIEPLRKTGVIVSRGEEFEFRHDLMRGFIAATWAVRHAPTLEVACQRLSDDRIWDLSTSDQDEVFPFLTELLRTSDELDIIYRFAAADPDTRLRLINATLKTANLRGWPLTYRIAKPHE